MTAAYPHHTDVYAEERIEDDSAANINTPHEFVDAAVNTFDEPPGGEEDDFNRKAAAYGNEHTGTSFWAVGGGSPTGEDDLQDCNAREMYIKMCRRHDVRVNKHLLESLHPEVTTHALDLMSAAGNVYAAGQLKAWLHLIAVCPRVTRVELVNQYLSPDMLQLVARVCESHPKVHTIDLSDNFIEHPEAKALLRMVRKNARILHVRLAGTRVSPAVLSEIKKALEMNSVVSGLRVK